MSTAGKRYLVAAVMAGAILAGLYGFALAVGTYVHGLIENGWDVIPPVRTLLQIANVIHEFWWFLVIGVAMSCFYSARLIGSYPSVWSRYKAYVYWLFFGGLALCALYISQALVGQAYMNRIRIEAPIAPPLRILAAIMLFIYVWWWVVAPVAIAASLFFAALTQSGRRQDISE